MRMVFGDSWIKTGMGWVLWGTDSVLRKGAYSSIRIQSMCWSGTFSPAFPTRFWTAQAHCWTTHATERDFNIEQTKPHTARGPPWHLLSRNFSLTFAGGGGLLSLDNCHKKGERVGVSVCANGISLLPQTVLQVAEEHIHRPYTL